MENSKELLEATVQGLQEKLESLNNDLLTKQRELEVINKPTINEHTYNLILEIIRNSVYDLEFSEDDFEYELTFGYDNKVELENIKLTRTEDMIDNFKRSIDKNFRVTEFDQNPTVDGEE